MALGRVDPVHARGWGRDLKLDTLKIAAIRVLLDQKTAEAIRQRAPKIFFA